MTIASQPVAIANPPDGIFIDVAGSAHLFQGEAALLKRPMQAPRS
jgi:hypothetical protein